MTEINKINIEKPDKTALKEKGITSWPIWEKEISTFDWFYDMSETCYILEGHARVEPKEGKPVEFGPGDMVTFPKGMECVWKITKPIRKHYNFG